MRMGEFANSDIEHGLGSKEFERHAIEYLVKEPLGIKRKGVLGAKAAKVRIILKEENYKFLEHFNDENPGIRSFFVYGPLNNSTLAKIEEEGIDLYQRITPYQD